MVTSKTLSTSVGPLFQTSLPVSLENTLTRSMYPEYIAVVHLKDSYCIVIMAYLPDKKVFCCLNCDVSVYQCMCFTF